MDRYPYLADIEWFLHDFNLLVKKDGLKAIEEGFATTLSLAFSGALGAKKKDLKALLQVDGVGISIRRRKHIQAVRLICLLSKLLNQPAAMNVTFVPLDMEKPCTPCIAFTGDSIEDAAELFLFGEKIKILRVQDATSGVAALMAAYWLFDVSYNRDAINLCCIFEHLFLNVNVTKAKCIARRFITTHQSSFIQSS
ncbi:hypothetical protein V5799_014908 [Amblyomma americanum]|uniref:Uncharacterized protein n=1 Tax=Amblyomma americanum TaxID=6943 RepID=A0AAQ4E1N7_AMBAM